MQSLVYSPNESGLNVDRLRQENISFQDTAGISQNNRSRGFIPAFLDTSNDKVYLSRFVDGRLAPIHLLDGLPASLIVEPGTPGSGRSISNSVISGFVLEQRFYTRTQAAARVERWEA